MKFKTLNELKKLLFFMAVSLFCCTTLSSQVIFDVKTIAANTGETIKVPVTVGNFTDIMGYEMGILVPEDKAEFIEISNIDKEIQDAGIFKVNNVGGGLIHVVWIDPLLAPHSLPEGKTLFEITMKVTAAKGESFEIGLDNVKPLNTSFQPEPVIIKSSTIFVGTLVFQVADVITGTGVTIDIPVTARNFIDVAGFQFSIEFEADKATFVNVNQVNTALTGFSTQNYFSPKDGTIKVLWDEAGLVNTTIDDDELLFNIRITTDAAAVNTFPVSINESSVFNNEPLSISSAAIEGIIKVLDFTTISGEIHNEKGEDIALVDVILDNGQEQETFTTTTEGNYSFETIPGRTYTVTPQKNVNSNNGINVADILFLRKHILGQSTLASAYKVVAADVDYSNNINVADIIILRKLILGTVTTLEKSWRFIPVDYSFSDATNPFAENFPENKLFANISSNQLAQDFIGIKVGDVDNNHDAQAKIIKKEVQLELPMVKAPAGSRIKIPVQVKTGYTDIVGWQATLQFNPKILRFVSYETGKLGITDANFGKAQVEKGNVTFLYDQKNISGETIAEGAALFYLVFDVIGKANNESEITFNASQIPTAIYNSKLSEGNTLKVIPGQLSIEDLEVTIFPNPGTIFKIRVNLPSASNVLLNIVDISGKQIVSREKALNAGSHILDFDASTLPKGIYFLEMIAGEQKQVHKLMVE